MPWPQVASRDHRDHDDWAEVERGIREETRRGIERAIDEARAATAANRRALDEWEAEQVRVATARLQVANARSMLHRNVDHAFYAAR